MELPISCVDVIAFGARLLDQAIQAIIFQSRVMPLEATFIAAVATLAKLCIQISLDINALSSASVEEAIQSLHDKADELRKALERLQLRSSGYLPVTNLQSANDKGDTVNLFDDGLKVLRKSDLFLRDIDKDRRILSDIRVAWRLKAESTNLKSYGSPLEQILSSIRDEISEISDRCVAL